MMWNIMKTDLQEVRNWIVWFTIQFEEQRKSFESKIKGMVNKLKFIENENYSQEELEWLDLNKDILIQDLEDLMKNMVDSELRIKIIKIKDILEELHINYIFENDKSAEYWIKVVWYEKSTKSREDWLDE